MQSIRQLLPKTYNSFFGQFSGLRPAQEQAIPLIMEGKNLLLISPTSSGKTEAVIAPLMERALNTALKGTYCLYICPTRALANDVERRISSLFPKIGLEVGIRHGDRKTGQGKYSPNLLITTPESLDVMLGGKGLDKDRLRFIRAVVIDEAHQLYQNHRGFQLSLLLERLKRHTKSPIQRVLLSATVSKPEELATWFQGSDAPFEICNVNGGRKLQVMLDRLTATSGAVFTEGNIVAEQLKIITQEHNKVLVFANSRNECDWLYWKTHEILGPNTFLHYSSLEKQYRETVEQRFQQLQKAVCFATSTLELGVDIGDIDAVVMYGAPPSVSSFIQRIGRGNRRSSECIVYGLCRDYHINGNYMGAINDLMLLYALVASMKDSELEIHSNPKLYSVVVQQSFSLAYKHGSVVPGILEDVITNANTHNHALKSESVIQILENLTSQGFYQYDKTRDCYCPQEKWDKARQKLEIWSNIASIPQSVVVDKDKQLAISEVPKHAAELGKVFLFAGKPRLVTEVNGGLVKTVPLEVSDPEKISYQSTAAPVPAQVTDKIAELLITQPFPDLPVFLDEALSELIKSFRRKFRSVDLDTIIPFEKSDTEYCYYTFGGTLGNELLKLHLASRMHINLKIDSWRLYSPIPIVSFGSLPSNNITLQNLIRANYDVIVKKLSLSSNFYYLPENLRYQEVFSLLELESIVEWFGKLSLRKVTQIS